MWGDNINLTDNGINWENRYKYVRNQIDDLGYMLSNVNSRKVGQNYVSVCPFPSHGEKTPSFTIYPPGYIDKNGKQQDYTSFYCYGCGSGGDVMKFRQLMESLDSKQDACIEFEKEYSININDENIRQLILKETLESARSANLQYLDFNKINLICSNICRDYLNWIRDEKPQLIKQEFNIIKKYYKHFDDEILECSMVTAIEMITKTQNIIEQRKQIVLI